MKIQSIITALLLFFSFSINANEKPTFIYDQITDLSPNAQLITRTDDPAWVGEGGAILRNNDDSKPFHWGPFAVKEISMMFMQKGEIAISADNLFESLEQPQTFVVDGIECTLPPSGTNPMVFTQKTGAPANSLNFTDYELSYCSQPLTALSLAHNVIAFDKAYSRWEKQKQNLDYAYTTFGEYAKDVILTLSSEQQDFLASIQFYANENKEIVKISSSLRTCYDEDENCNFEQRDQLPKIKLGHCEYEQFMPVELTELKTDKAKWTFRPDLTEKPLTKECETQILPYHLTGWKP